MVINETLRRKIYVIMSWCVSAKTNILRVWLLYRAKAVLILCESEINGLLWFYPNHSSTDQLLMGSK